MMHEPTCFPPIVWLKILLASSLVCGLGPLNCFSPGHHPVADPARLSGFSWPGVLLGFLCRAAAVGFLLSHGLFRVCPVLLWELLRSDLQPTSRPRAEDRLAGYHGQQALLLQVVALRPDLAGSGACASDLADPCST